MKGIDRGSSTRFLIAATLVVSACSGGNAGETDSAAAEPTVVGRENIAIVTSGTLDSGPSQTDATLEGLSVTPGAALLTKF